MASIDSPEGLLIGIGVHPLIAGYSSSPSTEITSVQLKRVFEKYWKTLSFRFFPAFFRKKPVIDSVGESPCSKREFP